MATSNIMATSNLTIHESKLSSEMIKGHPKINIVNEMWKNKIGVGAKLRFSFILQGTSFMRCIKLDINFFHFHKTTNSSQTWSLSIIADRSYHMTFIAQASISLHPSLPCTQLSIHSILQSKWGIEESGQHLVAVRVLFWILKVHVPSTMPVIRLQPWKYVLYQWKGKSILWELKGNMRQNETF